MATSSTNPEKAGFGDPGAAFATTRWSVVVRAQGVEGPESRRALEELCRLYWKPVYAFVRRSGHALHASEDLTQGFFAHLLAEGRLQQVDPELGRFRSFLLGSVKHFLANEWDRGQALKRGGGCAWVPLIREGETTGIGVEPAGGESPERAYDRQWALSVLDAVVERLGREHADSGKSQVFEVLKGTLTEARSEVGYGVLAERLGTTEGAVKVQVHRLRQRYRVVLREEIAATLADPSRVEEELRHLFAALTG